AEGLTSVLAALEGMDAGARPWPTSSFAPTGDGAWQLSTGSAGSNGVSIELPPDLLDALFSAGAANTLGRADATFELVTGAPGGDVVASFGLGIADENGQRAVGEVQINAGVMDLGLNQGGRFGSRTQMPATDAPVSLS